MTVCWLNCCVAVCRWYTLSVPWANWQTIIRTCSKNCAAGQSESQALAEADRRLGEPRTLVKKTVREYQRRYWCGRWPLLTFLLGPLPLVFLTWLALIAVAFCVIWPLKMSNISASPEVAGIISPSEYWGTLVAQVAYLLVAPSLALCVLSWIAKRADMGPKWVYLSASVLAVFAGLFWLGFAVDVRSDMPADRGMLMVRLPFLRFWHNPLYLAQIMLPLADC